MLLGLKTSISAYAVYDLPFGRGKQFGRNLPTAVNAVVGNWSINPIVSWHSGFPIAPLRNNSGTGTPESSQLQWIGQIPQDGSGPGSAVVQPERIFTPAAGLWKLPGSRSGHWARIL